MLTGAVGRGRLLDVVGDNTPLQDAFLLADDVLRQVWTLNPGTRFEISCQEVVAHHGAACSAGE